MSVTRPDFLAAVTGSSDGEAMALAVVLRVLSVLDELLLEAGDAQRIVGHAEVRDQAIASGEIDAHLPFLPAHGADGRGAARDHDG